jgi:formylglycine-generating enzyme required for sulfatase activity
MSEIHPNLTDTTLGGQNLPTIDAVVLGGMAGKRQCLVQESGLSEELIDRLIPNHQTFSFETFTVNRYGEIAIRTKKQAFYYTEDLGNDVKLDMVYIPAGSLMMGAIDNVKYPQKLVEMPAFYMSKYLITKAQYQVIMEKQYQEINITSTTNNGMLPVDNISWPNGLNFCIKLGEKTGKKYQLPLEIQWEYACRAGTTTPYHFGETITTYLANFNSDYSGEISRGKPTIVGSFPANSFGLYDMHGNVEEWCADSKPLNEIESYIDFGWLGQVEPDKLHVLRGGSYYINLQRCQSPYRSYRATSDNFVQAGLRIIRNI